MEDTNFNAILDEIFVDAAKLVVVSKLNPLLELQNRIGTDLYLYNSRKDIQDDFEFIEYCITAYQGKCLTAIEMQRVNVINKKYIRRK